MLLIVFIYTLGHQGTHVPFHRLRFHYKYNYNEKDAKPPFYRHCNHEMELWTNMGWQTYGQNL